MTSSKTHQGYAKRGESIPDENIVSAINKLNAQKIPKGVGVYLFTKKGLTKIGTT